MTILAHLRDTLHLDRLFGGAASRSCASCDSAAVKPAPEPKPVDADIEQLGTLVPQLQADEKPHDSPLPESDVFELKVLIQNIIARPALTDTARDAVKQAIGRLLDRSPQQGLAVLRPTYAVLDNWSDQESYLRLQLLRQLHWLSTSTFTGQHQVGEEARRFVLGAPGRSDGICLTSAGVVAIVECIRADETSRKAGAAAAPAAP